MVFFCEVEEFFVELVYFGEDFFFNFVFVEEDAEIGEGRVVVLFSEGVFLLVKSLFIEFTSGADGVVIRIKRLNDIVLGGVFEESFVEEEEIVFVCVIIGDIDSDICVKDDDEV